MDRDAYVRASRVAQGVVHAFRPGLKIDGKWGATSQKTFDGLSATEQAAVSAALGLLGTSVSEIAEFRKREKQVAMLDLKNLPRGADKASLVKLTETVARAAGLDPKLLVAFVEIESGFRVNAENGRSKGLCQMQPDAWSEARTVDPSLTSYEKGVFDPEQNLRAGAAYIKINTRRIYDLIGLQNPTPAQLYMMHQQGAGGFAELYTGRPFGKKDAKTGIRSFAVSKEAMLGNPPQDGKGKTVDRQEFLRRWIAVVEGKMRSLSSK